MKGEQLFKSLKVVTDAHQENIHEIISDLASEGNLSYSNIVLRAMDVMFSRLEVKTALTFTLSDKSHSMLFESLCMPDWTYILLKVRTKISDSAWQTLFNLTQLGRSGVCWYLTLYVDIFNNLWYSIFIIILNLSIIIKIRNLYS